MNQQESTEAFLEHYGVKGMKWGHRKQVIVKARQDLGKHERKLANAEQDYLKARKTGKKRATEKALANLNKTYKNREANRLTAGTMTRGEQLAFGVLGSLVLSPVGAAAGLGANKLVTRDSKPIGNYPVKYLKNLEPDD